MISYNARTDVFTKGGVKTAGSEEAAKDIMVEYICERVSNGDTLDKIIPAKPEKSKVWLPVGQLVELIDKNYDYANKLFRAEATRAKMLKEKFYGALTILEKNPTKENSDKVAAIKKALDLLDRDEFRSEPISIEFYANTPDDFWEQGEKPYERADETAN